MKRISLSKIAACSVLLSAAFAFGSCAHSSSSSDNDDGNSSDEKTYVYSIGSARASWFFSDLADVSIDGVAYDEASPLTDTASLASATAAYATFGATESAEVRKFYLQNDVTYPASSGSLSMTINHLDENGAPVLFNQYGSTNTAGSQSASSAGSLDIKMQNLAFASVQGPFAVTVYYTSNGGTKTDRYAYIRVNGAECATNDSVTSNETALTYMYTGTDAVPVVIGATNWVRVYDVVISELVATEVDIDESLDISLEATPASSTSVDFSWILPENSTSVTVAASPATSDFSSQVVTGTAGETSELSVTGLTAGTEYTFTFTVLYEDGTSGVTSTKINLLDATALDFGSTSAAVSFSKKISIDTQAAATTDGVVNSDGDVDLTVLQEKLDEFDAENDVAPYIVLAADTVSSSPTGQYWHIFYGAAAGSTKSGTEVSVSASNVNMAVGFDALGYALSLLPSRTAKYKVLIASDMYSGEPTDTAGISMNSKISNLYGVEVPSYTILDFGNHTLYATNETASAIVPLSMYGKSYISVRNVTIYGHARYTIWCQGSDNMVFDNITMTLDANSGLGLRIADRNVTTWSKNVYVDNINITGCQDNAVETMKVDGIYIGTVTGTDCNDCALLLNTTTNAVVGTVNGTRCSPRSGSGVYAAFRCANYVGPNVHVGKVIANECGRGLFSVSANHGITIDYLESTNSYAQAMLIQDTQNLLVKSGKLTGGSHNSGKGIELTNGSGGGALATMNNTFKNLTISGYSDPVYERSGKSDYTTLVGCTISGTVTLSSHSKQIASEAALASNATETSLDISGTAIADSAYRGYTALTSVTIPATVTSIGEAAFMNCTSLESVTIEGACTIGANAFYGCTSLRALTINGAVTSIGNCAFGETAIESVTLPASVTSFGHNLFSQATTSVTINSTGITTMGVEAFFNLNDASTITFADATMKSTVTSSYPYQKSGSYAYWGGWGDHWYGYTRSTIQ